MTISQHNHFLIEALDRKRISAHLPFFDKDFVELARRSGGKWEPTNKKWIIPAKGVSFFMDNLPSLNSKIDEKRAQQNDLKKNVMEQLSTEMIIGKFRISSDGDYILWKSPYHPTYVAFAHEHHGRFQRDSTAWRFSFQKFNALVDFCNHHEAIRKENEKFIQERNSLFDSGALCFSPSLPFNAKPEFDRSTGLWRLDLPKAYSPTNSYMREFFWDLLAYNKVFKEIREYKDERREPELLDVDAPMMRAIFLKNHRIHPSMENQVVELLEGFKQRHSYLYRTPLKEFNISTNDDLIPGTIVFHDDGTGSRCISVSRKGNLVKGMAAPLDFSEIKYLMENDFNCMRLTEFFYGSEILKGYLQTCELRSSMVNKEVPSCKKRRI